MMENPLIQIVKNKCTTCYACVRACPVRAIQLKVNQELPIVINERCIGCGSCVDVCASKAVVYLDSKEETKALIRSGNKVAAICGPSISGEFDDITDYRKFVQMIRALGFDFVNEVSFGVDLIAHEFATIVQNFKGKYSITANCPPLVYFIEKYNPELIHNLSPILNPMSATAKVVRKAYGPDTKVVYIGPCIGAKIEAKRFDDDARVDSVLTYVELRELFAEFNINESTLEFSDFDRPFGYKGSLYPVSEGLLEAGEIENNLLQGKVITTEGKQNMLQAVKQFNEEIEFIKRHFNIFYCEGCIMGPGTSKGGKKYIRRTLVTDYANKRLQDFDLKCWEKSFEEYSKLDFSRSFVADDQRLPEPSEEQVQEVLKVINKELSSDSGCESCGYTSCYDLAKAVAQGIAKPDMCISYSLKNKQEYIKALKSSNENLAKTQEALRQSEKKARLEQQKAKEASETISAMMQKLNAGVVIVDENLKIIESNKSFINILGEDAREIDEIIPGLVSADLKTLLPVPFYKMFSFVLTNDEDILNRDVHYGGEGLLNASIFTIRKNKIVGAIVRDLYSPEVRPEEVINRVTDVIDENLRLVQQIGFLLGEGASKTEKMLNSIIESYKTKKK